MLQAVGAERSILAILMKKPELLFEVDDVLSASDFTNSASRMVYDLIHDIVLENKTLPIDQYVLISRAEQKGLKDFLAATHNGELLEAIQSTNVSATLEDLGKHVNAVKTATLKRTTIDVLDVLKDDVEGWSGGPIELKNMVEEKVFNTMRALDTQEEDIESIPSDFEAVINEYADTNAILGLDVGMQRWQRDCGGLRNGTVTGVFARAKAGKSQFSAHCAVKVAIKSRIPCLYLDTELQKRDQQMRTCGILSGIQYSRIESGAWKSSKDEIAKIKAAFAEVKEAPFFYKNIAGRSVNHVIPVIRKFVHKYVGESKGEEPKCLIIYDYIKLMDMSDLKHAQEYQVLGFLLSAIHDVAAKLNVPILALGQLNREALKVDNEATVAGSDRITHNLDSLTLMRQKKPEEIETDGKMRGNYMFKTILARKGPGHDYNDWINVHFEKGSGQFIEDKRNSEIVAALQGGGPNFGDDSDIAPFGTIGE